MLFIYHCSTNLGSLGILLVGSQGSQVVLFGGWIVPRHATYSKNQPGTYSGADLVDYGCTISFIACQDVIMFNSGLTRVIYFPFNCYIKLTFAIHNVYFRL